MKNQFFSINQIKELYSIKEDDIFEIRNILKSMIKELHPDKTGGTFATQNQEDNYNKIHDAIEYIDKFKDNHSLVLMDKMTDMMKVFVEGNAVKREEKLEVNLEHKLTNASNAYKSEFYIPKLSISAVTIILTFLFFLPNKIEEHSIFSKVINVESSEFIALWLTMLITSLTLWLYSFKSEESTKKKISLLKVESVQNSIFNGFIQNQARQLVDMYENPNDFTKFEFSKNDFVDYIYEKTNNLKSKKYKITSLKQIVITIDIAQNIAEIVIARGEKNKVLRKVEKPTMSDIYEISTTQVQLSHKDPLQGEFS